MDPVLGIVDIQQDAPWHDLEAVAKRLDHRSYHAGQRSPAGQVLQPTDGRLRAQHVTALGRRANRPGRRAGPRCLAAQIAASDHQHPKADLYRPMCSGVFRRPSVGQALCKPPSDSEALRDPGQKQGVGICSPPTTVESGFNWLAFDR